MVRDSVHNLINKKICIHWGYNGLNRSFWFEKVLRCLIKKGRKSFVSKSMLISLASLKRLTTSPFFLFFEASEKIRPIVILRLQRKGKIWYQVPVISRKYRQYKVGVK